MFIYLYVNLGWTCDPAGGTPNAIYPQDNNSNVAPDTHAVFEMIDMYSDYIDYEVKLLKKISEEETPGESLGGGALRCFFLFLSFCFGTGAGPAQREGAQWAIEMGDVEMGA